MDFNNYYTDVGFSLGTARLGLNTEYDDMVLSLNFYDENGDYDQTKSYSFVIPEEDKDNFLEFSKHIQMVIVGNKIKNSHTIKDGKLVLKDKPSQL